MVRAFAGSWWKNTTYSDHEADLPNSERNAVLEYWSTGVLGLDASLHYSTTPMLRLQNTSE